MKRRPRIYYSACQRALIWKRWRKGDTLHQIARLFDRAHGSIHGIVAASGGIRPAERHRSRLALTLAEREEISRGIVEGRSIRAIAARLGRAPSTISREVRRNELAHLRRTRGTRRSRHHTQKTSIHGQISDAVSIRERPPAVEDRALPGHWEGDLLFGSKNSQIATLVERQSRYMMLAKVGKKDTETVVNALIKHVQKLPHELYRSLTWDRGKEMADHRRFTLAPDIKVYFCDPRSPWQRGSNENANGLLRRYLPKGVDLSEYSQTKLNAIARRLNERPRKTLQYETPAQRFDQAVASTG